MLTSRRFLFLFLVLGVAALVAAACGGGDGDDAQSSAPQSSAAQAGDAEDGDAQGSEDLEAEQTFLALSGVEPEGDAETRYFTDLQGALDLFGSAAASARQETLEAGGERAVFFQSFLNAGAGTAFLPVLERLQELDSPEGYEADHARLIALHEELAEIDRDFAEAARVGDFAALTIANARLARAVAEAGPDLSANTCNAVTRGGGATCSSGDPIPGGAYGKAVNRAMRPLAATILMAAATIQMEQGGFPPIGTAEENARIVATLIGEVTAVRAEVLAAVEALEPPDELAGDHVLLLQWLEDSLAGEEAVVRQAEEGLITTLIRPGSADAAALFGPSCRILPDASGDLLVILGLRPLADDPEFEELCAGVLGQ